jgi:hypothetical protein
MSPPRRHSGRPLMQAAALPLHQSRGLMSVETHAFAEFNLHLELRRLLWGGVAVLVLVLCVAQAARGR